jgi:hypothetical protein
MSLWDRLFGPVSTAANSATQAALNAQANQAATLAVLQAIVSATEAKILNPNNLAAALSVAIPPNEPNMEQTLFDIVISGYIKTTASGTIALGLYADASATVTAGNLLHKTASATTQNSTTAPFFIHAYGIYDSVSGKMQGKCGMMINNVIDPEIAFTNVPTGINNANNPVAQFSLSITSSGALTTAITSINVNKFSVG